MCLPDRRVRECFWRQHRSRLVRGFHAPRRRPRRLRPTVGRSQQASRDDWYRSRPPTWPCNGSQCARLLAKRQPRRAILISSTQNRCIAGKNPRKCQKNRALGFVEVGPLPAPTPRPLLSPTWLDVYVSEGEGPSFHENAFDGPHRGDDGARFAPARSQMRGLDVASFGTVFFS